MALIIKADGTEKDLPKYDLEALQAIVGGYIEGVHLNDGRLMYVNEDGRMKQLPVNQKATSYFQGVTHPILGDVVLLTKEETKAESQSD